MIKLSGVLHIKSINGRNGVFYVGQLLTELGEFSVKDTLLEQYDAGKYEGDFGISRIYPYSYFSNGRMVVEIRAKLETLSLASADIRWVSADKGIVEEDPLEEPVAVTAKSDGIGADTAPADTRFPDSEKPVMPMEADDEALFGALWPLGEQVKLDPTVDRGTFRTQRDRLKYLGYTFQALGQMWIRPGQ